MPEITLFGWFHTIVGIAALVFGVYSLAKFKVIQSSEFTGKIYLACTLIAAISALFIYHRDGFGPAHMLAVLTLLAVLVGAVAEKTNVFGKFSQYLQAISYTGTFLFHMIPAITDGLTRLPADAPIVTSIEDPLLLGFYMAFLSTYVIGVIAQIIWLRKRRYQIANCRSPRKRTTAVLLSHTLKQNHLQAPVSKTPTRPNTSNADDAHTGQ